MTGHPAWEHMTDAEIRRADKIAADFATIPFDDHEARLLALAYLALREAGEQAQEQR